MHERDLDRMQEVRLSDTFDRGHFAVLLHLRDLSHAGADQLAVQNDGACAADACPAADLRSGQSQSANNVRQSILFRITDEHTVRAVDLQCHLLKIHNLPP